MNLKMYKELAPWWQLLTPHEDYREEASFYHSLFERFAQRPMNTLLEMGSGGGNNAHYLKEQHKMTLLDLSEEMLEMSRQMNPECEHIVGDMLTARLGRSFDGVFVGDAIMYMTNVPQIEAVISTAMAHLRPGGVLLMAPDDVFETFSPTTSHGGKDEGLRGFRYLEWIWDPDPNDTEFYVDFAYLMRESDGTVRCESERHTFGLFSRETWMNAMHNAGLKPHNVPFESCESGKVESEVFIGVKAIEDP